MTSAMVVGEGVSCDVCDGRRRSGELWRLRWSQEKWLCVTALVKRVTRTQKETRRLRRGAVS